MAQIVLFCEGKESSLDYKVFQKLLVHIKDSVTIIPLGGKFGSSAYIQGWLNRKGVVNPERSFFLRDRDFDFEIPEQESLILASKDTKSTIYSYATFRTTLENYLIDPNLLFEHFGFSKKDLSLVEIDKIINDAAKLITNYSAARHSLGNIRKPLDLKTTWIQNGSGTLPDQEILNSPEKCKQMALKLVEEFSSSSKSINLNFYEEKFDFFLEKFSNPDFMKNKEYMIWYHGKDLQKAISILMSPLVNNFHWNSYYDFAIEKIDFRKFLDYDSFINRINSFTN